MQIININQSFKMGDLLSFADGYYEIAEESMPVLLKAKRRSKWQLLNNNR